jgi:nicotinamide-nucleotide amidase
MIAEIITIGDEILIGQIVDTNSAWMGQQLNLAGITVKQITSVSDNREHILAALADAEKRADIILITGGLGPTKDDITKKTLCEYFKTSLVFNSIVFSDVKKLFATYGKTVTPLNKLQAELPANCTPIRNFNGTAAGMWFEQNGKIYVSMPGVPYEMKAMMTESVIPELRQKFNLPVIVHKTVLTQGIGESYLSEMIADWENSLAEHEIKLAYLPSPGTVRLRLSVKGNEKEKLETITDKKITELLTIIEPYYFGMEEFGKERESHAQIIGKLLKAKNKTIAVAESCTGGYIAHQITLVPGSSAYFMGSVVPYQNNIKHKILNVDTKLFTTVGAVSKECVEQLAQGALHLFNTDYAIATSGIAGPDGATAEKPVGTIWIAIATKAGLVSEKYLFGNNRERNIQKAAQAAFSMLRKQIEADLT